jgi:hypothetical protein
MSSDFKKHLNDLYELFFKHLKSNVGGVSFQISIRKISFHPGQKLAQASIAMNFTKRKQKWREKRKSEAKLCMKEDLRKVTHSWCFCGATATLYDKSHFP